MGNYGYEDFDRGELEKSLNFLGIMCVTMFVLLIGLAVYLANKKAPENACVRECMNTQGVQNDNI